MERSYVQQLIDQGAYGEALQEIKARFTESQVEGKLYLGDLFRAQGKYEKALKLANELLQEKQFSQTQQFQILLLKGTILSGGYGKDDDSLRLLTQAEQLFSQLNDDEKQSLIVEKTKLGRQRALIAYRKGDFKIGLELLFQALSTFEKLNYQYEIARTLIPIGEIFREKGNYSKALRYQLRSLNMFEEVGHKYHLAMVCNNIGQTYRVINEYEQAQKYLQRALDYVSHRTGDTAMYTEILVQLIELALVMKDYSTAQSYLSRLEIYYPQGHEHELTIFHFIRLKYARALVLKSHERLRVRMKAQEIFHEIIYEIPFDLEYTTLATKHLCDLLLDELRLDENPPVLKEIQDLVNHLQEEGQKRHSFTTIVEALIIRSKLALLDGNLDLAHIFLNQAEINAAEHDLERLEQQAKAEKQTMELELSKWETLIQRNASFSERLEMSKIQNYIKKALKFKEP